MPYDPLSDEQREIRDLVRTLARERVAPRAAEIDKTAEFPWDMVELMRDHELFGLPFDEEYGGTGTGALMVLVGIEEIPLRKGFEEATIADELGEGTEELRPEQGVRMRS